MLLVGGRPDGGRRAWRPRPRLADQGIGVTVVDPRWVKPVDEALAEAAAGHRLVVDRRGQRPGRGIRRRGLPAAARRGVATPVRTFGLPQEFLEHGKREEILADAGLVPQHLARGITEAVARLTPELEHQTPS